MRHIGPGGISLPSAERLTRALRARRERGERRGRARIYDEDEVRDMIYGWHSGTVEPPQPLDSTPPRAAAGEYALADAQGPAAAHGPARGRGPAGADGAGGEEGAPQQDASTRDAASQQHETEVER